MPMYPRGCVNVPGQCVLVVPTSYFMLSLFGKERSHIWVIFDEYPGLIMYCANNVLSTYCIDLHRHVNVDRRINVLVMNLMYSKLYNEQCMFPYSYFGGEVLQVVVMVANVAGNFSRRTPYIVPRRRSMVYTVADGDGETLEPEFGHYVVLS